MSRRRCEVCGRPALAFAAKRAKSCSAVRAGRPVSLPGHTLCPQCWERFEDSRKGGGMGAGPSLLGAQIAAYCRSRGWPEPVAEHRFHEERRWRFDWAWPALMVAVEYEGTTRAGGRHQRYGGFKADSIKYSEAAVAGWCVLRVTAGTVGELWAWLDRSVGGRVGAGVGK